MKIALLQPPYPSDGSAEAAVRCHEWMIGSIQALTPGGCDLLLLPEYANTPGLEDGDLMRSFALEQGVAFLDRLAEESRRLECLVVAGIVWNRGARWLNGVAVFDSGRRSEPSPEKLHLTEAESTRLRLDPGLRMQVIRWRGHLLGFAPCFDLYFSEVSEALAFAKVDLVVSPSYQRSESPGRIRLLARGRALDTGAWLIRSGYAMEGGSSGGESLVAAPDGSLVATGGQQAGIVRCQVDLSEKWMKPHSHGQAVIEHRVLLEGHRRPGLYRNAQERIQASLAAPAPKLCAHRGLSHVCPENTLPAFSAALALGVHEIEFDLWLSRDGVPVVCHDPRVDRTTDGQGVVTDLDWADLRRMDAGIRMGELWRGIRLPRFEEVIELVDHRAVMNIHLKDAGPDGRLVRLVCDLLRRHGLVDLAYIAGHAEDVLAFARRYDPDIGRASLIGQDRPETQQVVAEAHACRRIQFPRTVTAAHCRRAHDAGLVCNLFYSDEVADARRFLDIGIDVLLTNRANLLLDQGVAVPLVRPDSPEIPSIHP
ncbi:MAG: glycerophosphodiester phosphodiesterase family protein [Opitutaceae bacterium]